jgi:hypothetical protein
MGQLPQSRLRQLWQSSQLFASSRLLPEVREMVRHPRSRRRCWQPDSCLARSRAKPLARSMSGMRPLHCLLHARLTPMRAPSTFPFELQARSPTGGVRWPTSMVS